MLKISFERGQRAKKCGRQAGCSADGLDQKSPYPVLLTPAAPPSPSIAGLVIS
jgi:hypothetical protein